MYSARSFPLTKEEYNYLLPVYPTQLTTANENHYFIDKGNDLGDILNRLVGMYTNWYEIPSMIVYRCFVARSLREFREFMNERN